MFVKQSKKEFRGNRLWVYKANRTLLLMREKIRRTGRLAFTHNQRGHANSYTGQRRDNV
jgi:hypothetical protein